MKTRLERYRSFIEKDFIEQLTRNKEYSLKKVKTELKKRLESGKIEHLVITGMGCSGIVANMIKGFFITYNIPIRVNILNDYAVKYLVDEEVLRDDRTLVIISSYSGESNEPIYAYKYIKIYTNNIIFLTSGGKLEKLGVKEGVSIINWKLSKVEREYPLFHAPQFFNILLDIFYELGIIGYNYEKEIIKTAEYLKKELSEKEINYAKRMAERLRSKILILLASPKWENVLLKLLKMHLNEIAMTLAYKNTFHEFTHSEIASYTGSKEKCTFIIFKDNEEHKFFKERVKVFEDIIKEKKNLDTITINIKGRNFLESFFSTLYFFHYITYYLGIYYNVKSRDLISKATGNFWYNTAIITKEKNAEEKYEEYI